MVLREKQGLQGRTPPPLAWRAPLLLLLLVAVVGGGVLAEPTPSPTSVPAAAPTAGAEAAVPTTSTTTTSSAAPSAAPSADSSAAPSADSSAAPDSAAPPSRSTRAEPAKAVNVADPLLDAEADEDADDVQGGNQKRDDQAAKEQHQVAILKQINRVNEDGSYTFGYEAADGSFKIETRDVLGHVKGMFGFIDESGQLKRVSYTAANGTGFQADPRDTRPDDPAARGNPQQVPQGQQHQQQQQQQLPGAVYQQVIRPQGRRRPSAVRLLVAPTGAPGVASSESPSAASGTPTSTGGPGRDQVIQQIPRRVRPLQQADGSVLTTASPSSSTTTAASSPSSRAPPRPVLVLATPAPGPDGSTPTPAPYGQFVRRGDHPSRRPVLLLGAASSTTTTTAAPVTEASSEEDADADGARGRDGNELRRQLPLPPLPPLHPLPSLAADRDVDPLGPDGLTGPGAALPPGAGQQLLRLLGRGDSGDVYGTAAAGHGHGLHGVPGLHAPHYSGVLRHGPRALQQQLLQQQILADLDLSPRPRPLLQQDYVDDFLGPAPPSAPAPTHAAPGGGGAGGVEPPPQSGRGSAAARPTSAPPLPPLQLEPGVAMALEQFLISRGIRLRPYRPPPPPPPPLYHPMRYRPPPPPYYEDDAYGYDPYLMRAPYMMYPRGYPYDPYQGYPGYPGYPGYHQGYQQPYPYPAYGPYPSQQQHHQQQQQQPLFVPVRPPSYPRRAGAAGAADAGAEPVQYADPEPRQDPRQDPRQELLLRMLLGRVPVQGHQAQPARGSFPTRDRVQSLQVLQARQQALQQAQLYEQLQLQQQQQQQVQHLPVVTTQAPVATSARVRSVKIIEPDAEGSEDSPTAVTVTVSTTARTE